MNTSILAAFATYFLILLTIGLIAHKKQTSDKDFIVGNRSLNFWVIALSAHASDMSAWLFMAFPAAIFIGGISQSWVAFGLMLGMFLNWQFVAKKLRVDTEASESYTLSTFFERRFKDTSGFIRVLTALMSIVFFAAYLSGGLMAMGLLFERVFGINYYIGLTVAIVVAVSYTFVGGFTTVAWMDLFQAIFLLIMILLVPIIAFMNIPGGFSDIIEAAKSQNISMSLFPDFSFTSVVGIVFLILMWGLGYFGQPHIITKFMGIKNPNHLRNSKYIGMSWMILTLIAAAAVGLVGIGLYPKGLDNPELVFVTMVQQLFPAFFAGIILCAVIAANMSTMDSQMLVCASVISEDVYKRLIRKTASPKELLLASRISVVLVGFISLLIAFNRSSTILATVLYAWTGLGCAFGPLVLMSLYSKSANKYGAIAGIVVGGVLAGTWSLINPWITSYDIPAMIPGFFLSLLSIYVVSNLTREREKILT
jgi:sodium/proline symporter